MRRMTQRRPDEKGAVIVLMAAFTVVMIAMAALVIDVGAVLDEKRQLQNGADAAALGLARYIGQTCPSAPTCTASTLQTRANDLAKANALDGFTGVDQLDVNYVAFRVTLRTSTRDTANQPILPYSFGQILTGVKGKEVEARAGASWAGLKTASVVRLTISRCEFNINTTNGTTVGATTVIDFHGNTTRECAGGVNGAKLPGGFGWLDDQFDGNPNDCMVTPSAAGTVTSDTGISNPKSCNMAAYLGKDVLLALYDGVAGSGSNGSYHVYGFGKFHITGYVFPSGGSGGPDCGSNACLAGSFVRFIPIGVLGGPNVGNPIALVS